MYAIITGASSGIGREIAILLAKRGYDLILVARREQRLKELKENLAKKYNCKIIVEACDLSEPKHCISLFKRYRGYPIRIVINNAGFGKVGCCLDIPLQTDISMINTNITAAHILTKLFSRHMKDGKILNIASMAAFQPGPMLATYSATKAYLYNFSLALNYELKRQHKNVRILTLCPGPVDTEFNKVAGANMALHTISAEKCARAAVKSLYQKKDLVIPTLSMKLLHVASRLACNKIMLPVEYGIQTIKLS